jgi:putative ABC transport system permease protein
MWRIAWGSVRGHLLRTVATAVSVVFGVAFVTGTFVFTDTVREAFEALFGSTVEGADLIVSSGGGADGTPAGVPPKLAGQVTEVPGVAAAEPRYRGLAELARDDGTTLGGFGAVQQGIDATTMPGALDVRAGRLPTADDEVAIDAASAEELGRAVGDETGVVLGGPVETYRITGLIDPPATVRDLAGSTTVVFGDAVAETLYGADGATYIAVRGDDGADLATLGSELTDQLGPGVEVLTVDELVTDSVAQVGDFLSFLTQGLLVFAGAALLVGAIIIFNTFGITVTQRTRELALMQAVGADSRQVLRAVLAEAVLIGIIGSTLGVAVGVGTAVGLRSLLTYVAQPLPSTGLVVAPRTVVIAFAVGIVVTVVAAVGPAVRASRRAPVDAMRSASAGARTIISTPRLTGGMLVGGLSVPLLIGTGLERGSLASFAVGAVALTLAVVLLSPVVAGPLTAMIGMPVRALRRGPGLLARANAVRNPGRTAATATALLIGLGLVTFVLILVSSFRASLDRVIVEQFRADYQLQAVGQSGFPNTVTEDARQIDGVEVASAATVTRAAVGDATPTTFVVDAATLPAVYDVPVVDGALGGLADGGIAVSRSLGIPLGARVAVQLDGAGAAASRPVVALTDDVHLPGTTRVAQALIDASALDGTVDRRDLVTFIKVAPLTDVDAVRTALDQVVAGQPDVRVADTTELRAQVREQTDRLLGLVIGLVLLSVLISFVGVVNALGLSVVERSGELGLLQALGMSRRQARQMVRWESVIITLLGSVVGLGLGTLFGWMGVRVLREEGLTTFSLPTLQLVIAIGVMLVAGVVASVVPARRASQVDVLRAVTLD